MRYIDYFIKCIIRRIVRLIFKPKILITLLFILLILTLSLYNNSYAAESGLFDYYSSLANQLINVLDKTNSTSQFYRYYNNPIYSYFIYYGKLDGTDMFNSSFDTSTFNVAFYKSSTSFTNTEVSSKWANNQCSRSYVRTFQNDIVVFSFDDTFDFVQYSTEYLYMPAELHNYRSLALDDYLREQKNVQQITDSITEGTDKIDNTINSTDYDENVVNIDTSSSDIDDSSSTQLFTTIFNNFSNLLINSNWETVETIDIPIPHSHDKLQLRSDILSKIVGTTFIATLINVAWYSLFGLYAFKFANNIFHAIKSGDILNGLNLGDEVITSSMM